MALGDVAAGCVPAEGPEPLASGAMDTGLVSACRRGSDRTGSGAIDRLSGGAAAAVDVAGRVAGPRDGGAGGCTAGCSSARRVTVPFRLKLESSRGPMFSAGGGLAGGATALSCAAAGTAASSRTATSPHRPTKLLTLLDKHRFPVTESSRGFGLQIARLQGRRALGGVDQHQLRVILGLDPHPVLALDGDPVARAGGDAVHPDPPARHHVKVTIGLHGELN